MTVTVTHSTPSDASFSASGASAWDANHTLTGVGTMATQNANAVAITGGTITGVTGIGTVTSVAALTLGSTGTDLSSTVATGTTTPVITLQVPTASATNRGVLSSTDWSTFNSKGSGTVTSVSGTAPVVSSGGATPAISMAAATTSVNGYLTSTDWNTFNGKGTVSSVAALTIGTTGTDLSSTVATGTTTPVITIQVPTASATNRGALSSTDWSTFNGKQAALVSGTNIKTINTNSLLGSGDITISAAAGGANTQVQYNSTGALAGASTFTWDGTTLKATNLETSAGVLADGSFSGTYTDGIVMDYTTGAGRISVGGADSLNFYNGGVAGSLLGSVNNAGDWTITRFLDIGNGTLIGGATNPIFAAAGSANNYVQAYVHNDNVGTSASADFISYPDNGADAHGWVDMGINSSTYADTTYTCTGPNEAYLFGSAPSGSSTTGNLVYATDSTGTANAHQWYVGGFTQAKSAWKMQLTSTGLQLANALAVGNGGTGATTAGGALTNLGAQATLVSGTNIKTVNSTSLVGSGDVAVQATLVSATNIKTINGASILGSGDLTVTGSFTGGTLTSNLTLAAGTTSLIPLTLQTGTLNTTASAGAVEYLGNTFYASIAASTRGAIPTEQWVVLTSTNTLTSQTGVQPIFDGGGGPTNGSVTLPVGTYQFECVYALTAMSATSGSFGFSIAGGTGPATFTFSYDATASKAGTAAATSQAGFKLFSNAASTALVTNSTGTVGSALIKGIIRVTVAGTIIPQVSLTTAAAAVVSANSYFKVSPIGNATVATVGNWA